MASIITQTSGGFDSLNDDTHGLILEFVGKKSYYAYGAIDKRCREIFLSKNLPKETFLYGYAPLSVIQELAWDRLSVGCGVLFYNRRDVLEWALLEKKRYILLQIFSAAVKVGRFDILNEIHDRSTEDVLDLRYHTLESVTCNESLDTLKWLYTRSYLDDYQIRTCAFLAAVGGHLNVLLWLQTKLPFDEEMKRDCAKSAALGGHLDILEWLQTKLPFNERLKHEWAASAARSGHLHVLEWLNENGCSVDSWTFNKAAEGGHLHILQWLIDNGCSFDERTFRIAALEGHMHVLEWLRNNNCPWDKLCYEDAAEGGHLNVLHWLHDNECPRGNVELELYEEALEDDVKVWLFDNGFSVFQYSDFEIDEYESYYEGGDYHHYGYEEYDSH